MKPDDVSQSDWDLTKEMLDVLFDNEWPVQDYLVMIALPFLMRAKAQAFDESAKIAEGWQESHDRDASTDISQAIRQHSQKGESE